MAEHFWLGMMIALGSGILNGIFPWPMKYSRGWKWENTWAVFALVSTVLIPLSLAILFVPNLAQVYQGVSARSLCLPLLFGFLWGCAQTTLGLGFRAVGVALGFSVVVGLNAPIGSLIPLLVFHPEDLLRPRGILLLVSLPVLILGLWLYATAGLRREKELPPVATATDEPKPSFATGLALCMFTGIFGANINLGFAFGNDVARKSLELGANPVTSTYPVWLLVMMAGFVPQAVYCIYLLSRNHNWGLFKQAGAGRETLLGIAMAALWASAIFSYGISATIAGKYGIAVCYTLLVAMTIVASTGVGLLTGEWKGTSGGTRKTLCWAMAIVLASVIILNLGGLF